MTFFDDFSKGAREANSPGAPQFARSAGELAARNLNSGGAGGAGASLGGGGGVVGMFGVVVLVFGCVYTVVVGTLALPGSLVLMLLAAPPAPGIRRQGRFWQAYVASFQGLFAYAWTGTVLLCLAYPISRHFPPLTAAEPGAFDRDQLVYAALALWQPLGLFVATSITSQRLAKKLPEAAGLARALIANLVPTAMVCAGGVVCYSIVKDGGVFSMQDIADAVGPYLIMAAFLLLCSLPLAAAGALAITFFNLLDKRGQHSFWQAFVAALTSVATFSGIMLSALLFSDLNAVLLVLPAALRTGDGIPEALAPAAIYLLLLLTVATLAATGFLVFKLGRSYKSVYGVFKSGVIATTSGVFSFAVVCLIAGLAQAETQRHYFPTAAPTAPNTASATPAVTKARSAPVSQQVAKKNARAAH